MLLGLHHMHSRKVLHRDIKTLNVFLDQDLNVKLGDMGVAKVSIPWGATSFQDGKSLEVPDWSSYRGRVLDRLANA